jgi:hypothetical protein
MFYFNTCKNDQKLSKYANEFLLQIYCCPWFCGFIMKTFEILNGEVILLIKVILKKFICFWIRDRLVKSSYLINGVTGVQRMGIIYVVSS